ncbi:MAG: NADH:flavin oxidoreductase [Planctomycetota bacterium]|nr:NADH:flavin oxidoreductase [Planctomycetota bacterium]
MRFPSPGRFRSASDLRTHLQGLGVAFDLDDEVDAKGALANPIDLFGRKLDNRFCAHPMEGWDGTAQGGPSPHTLRRWRNFGRSGAALIWGGEAFAVRPDGRANPNQLYLGPDSERHLTELLAEFHQGRQEQGLETSNVVVGLQLTHSGRFARPEGELAPKIAQAHPLLAERYGLPADTPLLSDAELEAIGECYVESARLAQRAGFDFVDVKCCHGYLLHELLAAHTREGNYGGDLAGRMRLPERIIAAIRTACPGLEIGVRLSAGDTAPFVADPKTRIGTPMQGDGVALARHHFGISADDPTAIDLAEPIEVVQRLGASGVTLLNITLGSPYWNPHLQRPAAYPPSDGYLPPVDPLQMVAAHLHAVRSLKAAAPTSVFAGTGYTYLQEWLPNVAQWAVGRGEVDFAGLGRLLLSYPELPADLLAGRPLQRKRLCRTFSDCTTGPRNGMLSGCFPLDPYYQEMPEAQRVKAIAKDLRR